MKANSILCPRAHVPDAAVLACGQAKHMRGKQYMNA